MKISVASSPSAGLEVDIQPRDGVFHYALHNRDQLVVGRPTPSAKPDLVATRTQVDAVVPFPQDFPQGSVQKVSGTEVQGYVVLPHAFDHPPLVAPPATSRVP